MLTLNVNTSGAKGVSVFRQSKEGCGYSFSWLPITSTFSFFLFFLQWQQDQGYTYKGRSKKKQLSMLLFCFFCKKLYCFHLVQGLGEGSRVVRMLPSGCREGLQAEAQTSGELLKGSSVSEAPSHDWGWAFQRNILPTQPGDQLACRHCWSGGLPSSRMWLSVSHRGGAMQTQKGCFYFFTMRREASRASWIFLTSLETLLHVPKEGATSALASCLPEVLLHPGASPPPVCGKSGPRPPEPHLCGWNKSPERGNGKRPTVAC